METLEQQLRNYAMERDALLQSINFDNKTLLSSASNEKLKLIKNVQMGIYQGLQNTREFIDVILMDIENPYTLKKLITELIKTDNFEFIGNLGEDDIACKVIALLRKYPNYKPNSCKELIQLSEVHSSLIDTPRTISSNEIDIVMDWIAYLSEKQLSQVIKFLKNNPLCINSLSEMVSIVKSRNLQKEFFEFIEIANSGTPLKMVTSIPNTFRSYQLYKSEFGKDIWKLWMLDNYHKAEKKD